MNDFIELACIKVGLTSEQVRNLLYDTPWSYTTTFHDPLGNRIETMHQKNGFIPVLHVFDASVLRKKLYDQLPQTKNLDCLAYWEKANALALKQQYGFSSGIRDTQQRHNGFQEWDVWRIDASCPVDDDYDAMCRVIIEVLQYASRLESSPRGVGGAGRHMVCSSLDANNGEVFILVNRHAFDMTRKEISMGLDMGTTHFQQLVLDAVASRLKNSKWQVPFRGIPLKDYKGNFLLPIRKSNDLDNRPTKTWQINMQNAIQIQQDIAACQEERDALNLKIKMLEKEHQTIEKFLLQLQEQFNGHVDFDDMESSL